MVISKYAAEFKFIVRSLTRSPLFAFSVVVTLALVIAANSSLFGLLYGLVLRQLPFANSSTLVMIWEHNASDPARHLPVTEGAFPIYQRELRSVEHLAAFVPDNPILPPYTMWGSDERVVPIYCSAELFVLLGARPSAGRLMEQSDNARGAEPVAIISGRFWAKHYHRSAAAIGEHIDLNEFGSRSQFTIIGVMPDDFDFPYPLFPDRADLWLSLTYVPRFLPGNHFYSVGRLHAETTLSTAQAELSTVAHQIQADYPKYYKGQEAVMVPIQSQLVSNVRTILWALEFALAFIFLIGCANLANLFLARSAEREKALAIRSAIGASKSLLGFHVIGEALLLSVAGTSVGLLIAYWLFDALPELLPPGVYVPRLGEVTISSPVLIFTVASCFASTILFALPAALYISHIRPAQLLSSNSGIKSKRNSLFRKTGSLLIVSEVMLAVALLTGALQMVTSLHHFMQIQEPYRPDKLLTLDLSFSNDFPDNPRRLDSLYRSFLNSAQEIHGIRSVALADSFPLSQITQGFEDVGANGAIARQFEPAEMHVVSPNFMHMIELSIRRGRWLDASDTLDTPPVAVINAAMADSYFPNFDPIGQILATDLSVGSGAPSKYLIVGIANESSRFGTGERAKPAVFASIAQIPRRSISVVANFDSILDISVLGSRAVESLASSISPGNVAVYNIKTGDEIVSDVTAKAKFAANELVLFSSLAITLSAVGVYSLISFYSSRRVREIGVRMALGATPAQVASLVIRQGLGLVGMGVILGILEPFHHPGAFSNPLFCFIH